MNKKIKIEDVFIIWIEPLQYTNDGESCYTYGNIVDPESHEPYSFFIFDKLAKIITTESRDFWTNRFIDVSGIKISKQKLCKKLDILDDMFYPNCIEIDYLDIKEPKTELSKKILKYIITRPDPIPEN